MHAQPKIVLLLPPGRDTPLMQFRPVAYAAESARNAKETTDKPELLCEVNVQAEEELMSLGAGLASDGDGASGYGYGYGYGAGGYMGGSPTVVESLELLGAPAAAVEIPCNVSLPFLSLHIKDMGRFCGVELVLQDAEAAAAEEAEAAEAAAGGGGGVGGGAGRGGGAGGGGMGIAAAGRRAGARASPSPSARRTRHVLVSNRQSAVRVSKDAASLPLVLAPGWNRVCLDLRDICQRAFGVPYASTRCVVIHPSCRVARVYFEARQHEDTELPHWMRTIQ